MNVRFLPASLPALGIVALSFLTAALFWQQLPEFLPIHFDISGNPDHEAPKAFALLLLPVVSLLMILFVLFIADRELNLTRDEQGRRSASIFMAALSVLFLSIQIGIILTGLYPDRASIKSVMLLGSGLTLILLGLSVRKMPPNRFLGFRFPWNRHDRPTWYRTQDLYYRWMCLIGTIMIVVGLLYPSLWLSLTLLTLAVLVPGALSYQFAKRPHPNPHRPRRFRKRSR